MKYWSRLSRAIPVMLWMLGTMCAIGCAWHGEGIVRDGGVGPVLQTSTGETLRLLYGPDLRDLAFLEGHIVVADGTRMMKTLTVRKFEIPVGIHGMPVFYGLLERRGVQLGFIDANSRAYYFLDREAWDELSPFVGKRVLVEGYVDGPHRVRVLQYRVLDTEK